MYPTEADQVAKTASGRNPQIWGGVQTQLRELTDNLHWQDKNKSMTYMLLLILV